MQNALTYQAGDTCVHRFDVRCKVALLIVYTACVLAASSWLGVAVAAAFFVVSMWVSRLSFSRTARMLIPLAVILLLTLVFNSFSFNCVDVGITNSITAPFSGLPVIVIAGTLGIVPTGFAYGLFAVIRIALLAYASVVLSETTSPTSLVSAFTWFMRPLTKLGMHTEDIAMMLSVAIRFIPLFSDEISRVRVAQETRGAQFSEGGPITRVRAWSAVLIPLFVGMFRRADRLADAMAVRCYGAHPNRTHLHEQEAHVADIVMLVVGIVVCLAIVFAR